MPVHKDRIILHCAECGVEFQKLLCQIKGTKKQYCSKACVGAAKRHGSTLYCVLCDSPFYRRFGEQDLNSRKMQFCSRDCYMEWRIINSKDTSYPKTGAVHIHRIVAEAVLGRPLMPEEVVHHIDTNKKNAKPSNLAVFPNQSYHARAHFGKMTDEELSRFSLQ